MLNKQQLLDRWNKVFDTIPGTGIYNNQSNFHALRLTPGSTFKMRVRKAMYGSSGNGTSGATGFYVRSTAIPAWVIGTDSDADKQVSNNNRLNMSKETFAANTACDAWGYYYQDTTNGPTVGIANGNWGRDWATYTEGDTFNTTTYNYQNLVLVAEWAAYNDANNRYIDFTLTNNGTEDKIIRFLYGFSSQGEPNGGFGSGYTLDDQNLPVSTTNGSQDGSIEILSYDIKQPAVPTDQSTPMVTSATEYQSQRVIPIYSGKHLISKKDKWENKFSGAYDNRDNFKLPATHSLKNMQVRLSELSNDSAKQYRLRVTYEPSGGGSQTLVEQTQTVANLGSGFTVTVNLPEKLPNGDKVNFSVYQIDNGVENLHGSSVWLIDNRINYAPTPQSLTPSVKLYTHQDEIQAFNLAPKMSITMEIMPAQREIPAGTFNGGTGGVTGFYTSEKVIAPRIRKYDLESGTFTGDLRAANNNLLAAPNIVQLVNLNNCTDYFFYYESSTTVDGTNIDPVDGYFNWGGTSKPKLSKGDVFSGSGFDIEILDIRENPRAISVQWPILVVKVTNRLNVTNELTVLFGEGSATFGDHNGFGGGRRIINNELEIYPVYDSSQDGYIDVKSVVIEETPFEPPTINITGQFDCYYGQSSFLTGTVSGGSEPISSIVWRSTNTGVATVTQTGEVRGISAGTTKIQLTANDRTTKEITFTVKDVRATITGDDTVRTGLSATYAASLPNTDVRVTDVSWSVNNTNLATINGNGQLTALATGLVTITALVNGLYSASKQVTVFKTEEIANKVIKGKVNIAGQTESFPIPELKINRYFGTGVQVFIRGGETVSVGESVRLWYELNPSDNIDIKSVKWESLTPNVAEFIEPGVVKPIANGQYTVKVTVNDRYSATATYSVIPPISNVWINGAQRIAVGQTAPLQLGWTPAEARLNKQVWTTDNSSVVEIVDQAGTIRGVRGGTTNINVKVNDDKTASLSVFCRPVAGVDLNQMYGNIRTNMIDEDIVELTLITSSGFFVVDRQACIDFLGGFILTQKGAGKSGHRMYFNGVEIWKGKGDWYGAENWDGLIVEGWNRFESGIGNMTIRLPVLK